MTPPYTVKELNDLRTVVERKWLFGSYNPVNSVSRSYGPNEKVVAVEQMVRTHMLAGHYAADLLASESVDRASDGTYYSQKE